MAVETNVYVYVVLWKTETGGKKWQICDTPTGAADIMVQLKGEGYDPLVYRASKMKIGLV